MKYEMKNHKGSYFKYSNGAKKRDIYFIFDEKNKHLMRYKAEKDKQYKREFKYLFYSSEARDLNYQTKWLLNIWLQNHSKLNKFRILQFIYNLKPEYANKLLLRLTKHLLKN